MSIRSETTEGEGFRRQSDSNPTCEELLAGVCQSEQRKQVQQQQQVQQHQLQLQSHPQHASSEERTTLEDVLPHDAARIVELLRLFDLEMAPASFGNVLSAALAFVSRHLAIPRCSVALVCDGSLNFRIFDTTLPITGIESGALMPAQTASLAETVRERRSIYRKDLLEWPVPNPVDEKLLAAGLRCTFSTPLTVESRCIGSLNAAVQEVDGLPATHRVLLELIAPRLAHAIENGREPRRCIGARSNIAPCSN